MVKYIIYEIRSIDKSITYSYIGSTMNFTSRKGQHKTACKKSQRQLYFFIRANGGWDNYEMVPLETLDCDTVMSARIREQHWIEQRQDRLNLIRAYSPNEEIICECGHTVTRSSMSGHLQTSVHSHLLERKAYWVKRNLQEQTIN
jgi:hypothetical protein